MKQPDDIKTLELPIDPKRGRGRPSKADALTQAERAKRYRANKKQNPVIKSDETEIANDWANERERQLSQFRLENKQLQQQLELAESERDAAFKAFYDLRARVKLIEIKSDASLKIRDALAVCLQARASKKRLSDSLADSYLDLIKSDTSQ